MLNAEDRKKVEKIQEALEMTSMESHGYYNTETGEILWINEFDGVESDEAYWEENWDKYIALPTQYDIHEYSIMEDYALTYNDRKIGDILFNCLKGRGAFRRFKDKVYALGIEQEWFDFRDNAYRSIALKWLTGNGLIEYDFENI